MCARVWCQGRGERRQKHSAGENRQVVSDGEIGTGIKRDRERERIKGTVKGTGKQREIEHQKVGRLGMEGESPRNPVTDSLGQEGDSTME